MAHQGEAPSAKPAVLILGTGHLDNPNRDNLNVRYDDMLAPKRQREIRECVERLKRFRPTKVALEVVPEQADELTEQYRRYRAGVAALTANERQQFGFRLAAELGHEAIYAIDWQGIMGWDRALSFAREHGQSARLDAHLADAERANRALNARITTMSVLDMLRMANDPANNRCDHHWYMLLALVGEGEQYVGADVIGNWYGRNLRIFVNLTRITTTAEDRILVVIGSGHLPLLTHFIQGSGLYTLESTASYLNT